MDNERTKILKMLENREITADEASKLLSALENTETYNKSYTKNENNSNLNSSNSSNVDFSKIMNKFSNIASTIVKKGSVVVNSFEKEIKNVVKNISDIKSDKPSNSISKEFNYNLTSTENNIRLMALNGEMHLKGYNGDKLTLRVIYSPLTSNASIDFYSSGDNNYILQFKQEEFEKVSIEALVPIKYFKQININNVNSNFSIDTLKFDTLVSRTHNSNGIVENCEGNSITLDNTNGKFIVRNILGDDLNINTINGFVKLKNLDVRNVNVDNINGSIEVVNDYFNRHEDYNWFLETQNSPITVEINTDNVNYKVKAQTTLGNIDINKNNLTFSERTAYSVLAETSHKNINNKYMNITLITTNSKILLS